MFGKSIRFYHLDRRFTGYLIGASVVFAWIAVALVTYAAQFKGGWRFDDAHHLKFLSEHRFLQYFYDFTAARLQSGAHFTPFNILTYDIPSRFFPLTSPRYFYIFHVTLIGLSAGALFFLLRAVSATIPALIGTAFFLFGMPIAGMAGQLMVGHYITGFIFTSLCLLSYEHDRPQRLVGIPTLLLYFLACLSKEIFVPIIIYIAVDPREAYLRRAQRLVCFAIVLAIFWGLRGLVIGAAIGGYNDGFQTSPWVNFLQLLRGLFAYGTLYTSSIVLSILTMVAAAIVLVRNTPRFGVLAMGGAALGAALAAIVPIMPVSMEVTPASYVEIRLLSAPFYICAFVMALATAELRQMAGKAVASVWVALLVVAIGWNSHDYRKYSPVWSFAKEFDQVSRYVTTGNPCNLIDKYGWSSWAYDLRNAVGRPQPQRMAAEEILKVEASPGEAICTFDRHAVQNTGTVGAQQACDLAKAPPYHFHYDGTHLFMDFGGDREDVYYIEVMGKYVLKVSSRFLSPFPDPHRFASFRILKIYPDHSVGCTPVDSYDPLVSPDKGFGTVVDTSPAPSP